MQRYLIFKRTCARLVAVGAAVAVAQMGSVGTADALLGDPPDGGGDCGYAAPEITTTELVLSVGKIKQGQSATAVAHVTVGGKQAEGTVTFAVAGYAASTVALSGGSASYSLPTDLAGGTYEVTAVAAVPGCVQPSSAAAAVTVEAADVIAPTEDDVVVPSGDEDEDVAPPAKNPRTPAPVNRPVPVAGAPTVGLLPSVGVDGTVQMVGLAGVGLVGLGLLTLMLSRRRLGRTGSHRA